MLVTMATEITTHATIKTSGRPGFSHIAVGVNGLAEGEDALALGAALAGATEADVMLVAVNPDLLVVAPEGLDRKSLRRAAQAMLRDARNRMAPQARMVVEGDVSLARALKRVIRRDHRDLLVLGSSRRADHGHVLIGRRTRQLLGQVDCALAIAPRGWHSTGRPRLRRIGVGYDGGPEARAALELAASLASAAGAELHVQAVLDDRLPLIGWTPMGRVISEAWDQTMGLEAEALRTDTQAAVESTGVDGAVELRRGRPSDCLLSLSAEVDLLMVGSRRWGAVARVVLGSTGEALVHGAACPVVTVPRPRS
jgi:nucleotide-binding universal stress UspA family protein